MRAASEHSREADYPDLSIEASISRYPPSGSTACTLVMAMKKLTGIGIISSAAKHNFRELPEKDSDSHPRIDRSRSHLNYVLAGPKSAALVSELEKKLRRDAGITKYRKNGVHGIEIIFSLPPGSEIDYQAYFNESTEWVARRFGAPLLSSVVHLDEAAPHCHVILLPLVNGRMNGADLMGHCKTLQTHYADFYIQVAQRFGLKRPSPARRFAEAEKKVIGERVLDALARNSALLENQIVRQLLLGGIHKNLESLAKACGVDGSLASPKRKLGTKSFVEIMTSPVKPEKPSREFRKRVLEPAESQALEETQSLSCVGFCEAPMPNPSTKETPSETHDSCIDENEGEAQTLDSLEPTLGPTDISNALDSAVDFPTCSLRPTLGQIVVTNRPCSLATSTFFASVFVGGLYNMHRMPVPWTAALALPSARSPP